jgi:hypothetical protein
MIQIRKIILSSDPTDTLGAVAESLCAVSRHHQADVEIIYRGITLHKSLGDGLNRHAIETLFHALEAERLHSRVSPWQSPITGDKK